MSAYNSDGDMDLLEREGIDLSSLAPATGSQTLPAADEPDLSTYDRAVVAFSGGKDSVALVLHLLERGFPRDRIELHHHLVDGNEGSALMDWECTHGYAIAFAQALQLQLTLSWRANGFEGEMLRLDSQTAPMMVPDVDGGYRAIGGNGPRGTRRRFP